MAEAEISYAGRGALVRRPTDLGLIVQDMQRLLRASLASKIRLDVDTDSGLPLVEADRARMRQVVLNLITNAADAIGEDGGTILVRTKARMMDRVALNTIGARTLPAGQYAVLTVVDDGPGIDPEIKSRIFEPFFTTKKQGRGLGLAAIAGIVRAHGGVISVETQPGQGATFQVLLPSARLSLDGLPKLTEHPVILVADDEVAVRDATCRILQAVGCSTLTAADGLEVVDTLARARIDLLLLDLTMPRMDGLTALHRLRSTHPDLPVILVTAYPDDPRLARALEDPKLVLVAKPWAPAALVDQVRSFLDR